MPRTVSRTAPALFLLFTALAGCSVIQTPRTLRGNHVDPDSLKELTVGISSKKDANTLLGPPTAHATFDDNEWIYISETTHTRIGQTPGVLKQDVTVLNFDPNGTLRTIKRLNQDDARDVSMVSRATPSPGSEASFLQQLLGNVGKYNVGGLGASTDNAPGGGVGSSRGNSNTTN